MATIIDIIAASRGVFDTLNTQSIQSLVILNEDDLEQEDIDMMYSALQNATATYMLPYAQSMYNKQPDALTDAEKYNVYEAMTNVEYINMWNLWFDAVQSINFQITVDFSQDETIVLYYSFYTNPYPVVWVVYNTPSNGSSIQPLPLSYTYDQSAGYILTSTYLSSYTYNGQTYGWFNNPELSGTALSANAVVTPNSAGYVKLYTAVPIRIRIFTMHANGQKDILYPKTNSLAVIMQDGTTLQSIFDNMNELKTKLDWTLIGSNYTYTTEKTSNNPITWVETAKLNNVTYATRTTTKISDTQWTIRYICSSKSIDETISITNANGVWTETKA